MPATRLNGAQWYYLITVVALWDAPFVKFEAACEVLEVPGRSALQEAIGLYPAQQNQKLYTASLSGEAIDEASVLR